MPTNAEVIKRSEARVFMEGPEECRDYVRNDAVWFGTSLVPVGATGGTDPGHAESWEVFYVAAGNVTVHVGSRSHELAQGDAMSIPPGVPHTITNVGAVPALVCWAGAPGE